MVASPTSDAGARKSEALELTWDNVELDRKPRPVVHFTETKGGKVRSVPLPLRCADILRHRRLMVPLAQRLVFVERARKDIWETMRTGQLYAKKGHWIPLSGLPKRWRDARLAAELPELRMHDLWHTYASKLVRRGVPLLPVSKLLGHCNIGVTMKYAHLWVQDLDEYVGVLDCPVDGRTRPHSWASKVAETRRAAEIAEREKKNAKRRRARRRREGVPAMPSR